MPLSQLCPTPSEDAFAHASPFVHMRRLCTVYATERSPAAHKGLVQLIVLIIAAPMSAQNVQNLGTTHREIYSRTLLRAGASALSSVEIEAAQRFLQLQTCKGSLA